MNPSRKILVFRNGEEQILDFATLLKKLNIFSTIRIPESEYGNIYVSQKYFIHFNLEATDHKVGGIYALPKILRYGSVSKDKEVLPLLSFDDVHIAECLMAENNLKYDDLRPEVFEFSMIDIKDKESLQAKILNRYIGTRPDLSREKILSKGVGLTFLKILRKIEGID